MSMANAEITDVYVRAVGTDGDSKIIDIAWSTKAHGFGVLTIVETTEETFIRSEHLSSDFAKRVLCKLVDLSTVV